MKELIIFIRINKNRKIKFFFSKKKKINEIEQK